MKKEITLHKSNEMIRGGDRLSVHAKRLLNSIYYLIQTNVNKGNTKAIENATYIPLEFPYLRKMMGLEKVESYIKEIENAFAELQEPIQLNNFKNPRDNQLYQWYSISIISEASWRIDNNKKTAYIALAPLAKWLMINTNEGNFTKLDLIPIINKLRTKYAMKLYEYLKSFGGYKYLDISQKHLMKLLGFEPDHTTYKHYANLKQLIERQIKEIAQKTDLVDTKLITNKTLAKDKIFRIIINPKSKKSVDKIEAKTALENLIKRF
jgi:hypothetical protein